MGLVDFGLNWDRALFGWVIYSALLVYVVRSGEKLFRMLLTGWGSWHSVKPCYNGLRQDRLMS